jgi:hypothetical protein
MCFFLTIAVPAKHVDDIVGTFGRGFQTHHSVNAAVSAALPEGYVAHVLTSGMCSCDLYARPGGAAADSPADHLRRKYEKRGWSEAKIVRALKQAEAAQSKSQRPICGVRADVVERLQSLCQSGGGVALLVHWYNGDIDTERFSPSGPESCRCDELPARAQELREDVVVIARPNRAD